MLKKLHCTFACDVMIMAVSTMSFPSSSAPTPKPRVWSNSMGMKLVHLPGGSFAMGDAQDAPPVHTVALSPFWIGQYEVTNQQYELFRKNTRPVWSLKGNQPVANLSWNEADAFCRWLSRREGRTYRLPTEAEWEYAARGGLKGKRYPWGNENPGRRATLNNFGKGTTPVGSYAPNAFGLYDMIGNAQEWVSDWYDEHYYQHSPRLNPKGPAKPPKTELKTLRGGDYAAWEATVAQRQPSPPDLRKLDDDPTTSNDSGFRVVLEDRKKAAPQTAK